MKEDLCGGRNWGRRRRSYWSSKTKKGRRLLEENLKFWQTWTKQSINQYSVINQSMIYWQQH